MSNMTHRLLIELVNGLNELQKDPKRYQEILKQQYELSDAEKKRVAVLEVLVTESKKLSVEANKAKNEAEVAFKALETEKSLLENARTQQTQEASRLNTLSKDLEDVHSANKIAQDLLKVAQDKLRDEKALLAFDATKLSTRETSLDAREKVIQGKEKELAAYEADLKARADRVKEQLAGL